MVFNVPRVITKSSDSVIFVENVPSAQVAVIVISLFLYIGFEKTLINARIAFSEVTVTPLSPLPYFRIQLLARLAICTFFNAGLTVIDWAKEFAEQATFTSFTVCRP